jgi:hypothetical protein
MLEMRVRGICRCRRHALPSILLEDAPGEHVLALGLPPGEAERIAHELRRAPACDPSIFTAFLEAIRFLGAEKLIAWLDLHGKELVGGIALAPPGREVFIRCAPLDVAVLAAVARIPTRIGRALARDIEAAPSGTDGHEEKREADVAEWLERVRPEDFR